ncbi:MAG: hypothetical protein LBQ52_03030 [Helicobacteraceae bacterium]|jgi:hypothetical protein|nr:hypothetical protein [Helicobacteraceae bacterium]
MSNNKNDSKSQIAAKTSKSGVGKRNPRSFIERFSDRTLIRKKDVKIERRNGQVFIFNRAFFNEATGNPYLTAPDSLDDEQILEILHDLNGAYKQGYDDGIDTLHDIYKERREDAPINIAYDDCVLIREQDAIIKRYNRRAFLFDATYLGDKDRIMGPRLSAPDCLSDEQIIKMIPDLNRAYRKGYEDCLAARNDIFDMWNKEQNRKTI